MARLIKETPTLRGKDAENFIREIENSQKISSQVNVRIKENFNKMKSIAQF
jgi:hypothetical protein